MNFIHLEKNLTVLSSRILSRHKKSQKNSSSIHFWQSERAQTYFSKIYLYQQHPWFKVYFCSAVAERGNYFQVELFFTLLATNFWGGSHELSILVRSGDARGRLSKYKDFATYLKRKKSTTLSCPYFRWRAHSFSPSLAHRCSSALSIPLSA